MVLQLDQLTSKIKIEIGRCIHPSIIIIIINIKTNTYYAYRIIKQKESLEEEKIRKKIK